MLSSFYPVVSGRVSDALTRNRSLYQTQTGKIELQRLQDQLSSGNAFNKPSENPIAALRVIAAQRQIEYQDQYILNLDSANSYLNATESNLANIASLMNDARGIALEASTTTSSQDERDSWIQQINTSIARLQTLANAQYMDRHLFSGGSVDQPTVGDSRLPNSNGIVYLGNDLSLNSIASNENYLAHNVTGQSTLGLLSKSITGSVPLAPAIAPSTKIADLNGGRGVTPGSLEFSNGMESVTIDISNSEFVQDVLDKVNGSVTLAGRPVSISISGGALEVAYTDGLAGPLKITDPSNSRTAYDLGIETKFPVSTMPIVGQDLATATRLTTELSQLNGGLGFDWGDGLRIRQGEQIYDVSFAGAVTVEDALNAINRSGALVNAALSPDGKNLEIKSRLSGVDFSISESNGELASQLGLQTFHARTRLSDLNYGQGITLGVGPDLSILRNDGSELLIDLDGVFNVQDVLDRINDHPDNQLVGNRVEISLSEDGNGFQFRSSLPSPPATADSYPLVVRGAGSSDAAWGLGIVARGALQSTASGDTGEFLLQGTDPNPQEVTGVFNSLLRLRDAITNNDLAAIARASSLIEQDSNKINLSRGSIGIEQSRIENIKFANEDSKLQLQGTKADLMEVDMVAAITELNARQTSYEASLRFLASASQLSLFNYL